MNNKIGVSIEWMEKLRNLACMVEDPAARELLREIVNDLYEVDLGDCE